jgi:hypothetical protein
MRAFCLLVADSLTIVMTSVTIMVWSVCHNSSRLCANVELFHKKSPRALQARRLEDNMGLASSVFAALLQDTAARKVLEAIAREKKLQFKDLSKTVQIEHLTSEDASKALELLKTAGLIGEETAPIADFHTYYVTAEGLSAERQLRRLKAA